MYSKNQIIISCEHGGNQVPENYRRLFTKNKSVLKSHRAFDAGALILARNLSKKLGVPLFASETTRLLIDLNRSRHHHHLFSEFTRECNAETKEKIIRQFYLPYRNRVETMIKKMLQHHRPVIHFSVHSFTPVLHRKIRNADIGLLYDPKRKTEGVICKKLQSLLENSSATWNVRRNYPYRGNADGFTTYLRKQFPATQYVGIEIEINQKYVNDKNKWHQLRKQLVESFIQLIQS